MHPVFTDYNSLTDETASHLLRPISSLSVYKWTIIIYTVVHKRSCLIVVIIFVKIKMDFNVFFTVRFN